MALVPLADTSDAHMEASDFASELSAGFTLVDSMMTVIRSITIVNADTKRAVEEALATQKGEFDRFLDGLRRHYHEESAKASIAVREAQEHMAHNLRMATEELEMQRARNKIGEAELAKLTAELNVKSSAAITDANECSRLRMEVEAATRRVEQLLQKVS